MPVERETVRVQPPSLLVPHQISNSRGAENRTRATRPPALYTTIILRPENFGAGHTTIIRWPENFLHVHIVAQINSRYKQFF